MTSLQGTATRNSQHETRNTEHRAQNTEYRASARILSRGIIQ